MSRAVEGGIDRWAASLGTARPIPLWRLRSGPREPSIDLPTQGMVYPPDNARTGNHAAIVWFQKLVVVNQTPCSARAWYRRAQRQGCCSYSAAARVGLAWAAIR
jgi:hypothetical protein